VDPDGTSGTGRDPSGRLGPDRLSTVELVQRAKTGDQRAIDQLFTRYLPILRRWAAGRLPAWARDLVDTDDMIQDTLMRTFRNVAGFEPRHDGALGAYLRQALNNRIRDEIRKVPRRPRKEEIREDHVDEGASPLEQALGTEALQRYDEALHRLPIADQELIVARIEMGLTYEQVAEATSRPTADAARMAVGRALVRLASSMEEASR